VLGQAVTAADIASAPAEALWHRVLPPESALPHLRAVRLGADAADAFVHGQPAVLPHAEASGGFVRAHDESGTLLGVGELIGGGRLVQPSRILHADRPGTRVLPA